MQGRRQSFGKDIRQLAITRNKRFRLQKTTNAPQGHNIAEPESVTEDVLRLLRSAVCGRPAGGFCIPTRWPAPPRREDLNVVYVGGDGSAARRTRGKRSRGVTPARTVGLGRSDRPREARPVQSGRSSPSAIRSRDDISAPGWVDLRV